MNYSNLVKKKRRFKKEAAFLLLIDLII